MSSFLTPDDYNTMMPMRRREQASDSNSVVLDSVEKIAIQTVRDALCAKYDVDFVFAQRGANRPAQVLRWVIVISVYQLYERIPDQQVPERITAAYDNVLETLRDIEDGKKNLELPLKTLEPRTKARYGSNPPRSHF